MTQLKILTLNCWGIPFIVAKYRKERIHALADLLSAGEYDIVVLQEIWLKSDYQLLYSRLQDVMPYSHYFYSGMIGSGVCLFSKEPIQETVFNRFHLNGYAHKVHHADWYCSKGTGLCQIMLHNIRINIYITHIHAEYDHDNDEYLAHRVCQLFEMSQFIKHTSHGCDVVIAAGDFNMEEMDLGYKLLKANGRLNDSWLSKKEIVSDYLGNTCEVPTNSFVSPSSLTRWPNGKRIDYIFYRANAGSSVVCERCYLPLDKIPDKGYNYSDHEAVAALFEITPSQTVDKEWSSTTLDLLLQEAVTVIDKGLKRTQASRGFYLALSFLAVFCLYLISGMDIPYGLNFILVFLRLLLTVTFAFGIWMRVVINKAEENALLENKADILNLIRSTEMNKRM